MYVRFARLIAILFVALLCVAGARAQENATITGTVSDPSGAVVPNAQVTLVNPSTSQERTAASNSSGLYIFSNVGVGRFNLRVAGTGFQGYIKRDIVVNVTSRSGKMSPWRLAALRRRSPSRRTRSSLRVRRTS